MMRQFIAKGDPVWKDGTEIHLELESSGRVSWVIWKDGLDYGGDTRPGRGQEVFDQAAAELLASGHWSEV